jgi:hypothetical protein
MKVLLCNCLDDRVRWPERQEEFFVLFGLSERVLGVSPQLGGV